MKRGIFIMSSDYNLNDTSKQDSSFLLSEASHAYVEIGKKYEDVKSTAYTFLIIGCLGIVLLILLWIGILPISFSFFTQCMFTVVLGILFIFFLFVGIRSFREMKSLVSAKNDEECTIIQIKQWFEDNYSADAISNGMDTDDISLEQLYFLRSENINRLMKEAFPTLEENFLEYMTEKIYQMYFPD